MVVSTAASSQKTSLSRSASVSSACHSTHASRSAWTSGRRCSAAWSVFFLGRQSLLKWSKDQANSRRFRVAGRGFGRTRISDAWCFLGRRSRGLGKIRPPRATSLSLARLQRLFSKDCRSSFFYGSEGEVGLRCQELADLVVAFRADGRFVPPGVGPRPQRPGLFAQAQQVVDGIDGDAEAAGDLGGGAVAVSDGVEDAFPQGH